MKKQAVVDVAASNKAIWDRHQAAIVGNFLAAAAAGAGGMGLFNMMKRTKQKLDTYAPKQPDYNQIATAYVPPALPQPTQPEEEKEANDPIGPLSNLQKALFFGMPLAGAGAGAYLNARRNKTDKYRAALTGAAMGGGLGLAGGLATTDFGKLVREAPFKPVPNTDSWGVSEGKSLTGRMAALPLGLMAGGYAADKLINMHSDKSKQKKNINAIEDARDEYFNTLLADKAASVGLDAAYAAYAQDEKSAWWGNSNKSNINLQQNEWGAASLPLDAVTLAVGLTGLASLGAAGVGGTYMYNKTKSKSDAKQLQRARLAKERMSSLPGAWIDPREVAHVKELAAGNQPSNNDA
jgi:hypothetical protein